MTNLLLPPPPGTEFGLLERDVDSESPITQVCYEDRPAFKMIPRSQWKPTNNRRFLWHVFAQLDGHCAANAAAMVPMFLRERQGLPRKKMNASRLYATHSRNGTGSTLAENLDMLTRYGVTELKTAKQQSYSGPKAYSAAEKDEAAHYKVLEWIDLGGDFDRLACALQSGFVGPIGSRKAFGGAHSVLAADLIRKDGKWGLAGPNSWGETWSEDGWYEGPESAFSDMEGFGCWVGLSVVHSDGYED